MKKTTTIKISASFAVLLILLSVATPNIIGRGENQTLAMRDCNVQAVYNALQIYAASHGRHYPASAEEASHEFLRRGAGYLPDDLLMASPYGGQQERLLPVEGPLGSAENPTQNYSRFDTFEFNSKPAGWNHLGAVLYGVTPDRRHCVIYGITHKECYVSHMPWYWDKWIFKGVKVLTRIGNANDADDGWLKERERIVADMKDRGRSWRSAGLGFIAKPTPGLRLLYF